MRSLNPEFSYNHIFNAGRYNTDVSGVYFPSRSQRYAVVHHNWFHNINGNAVRLDISGKELNVHHNVFWSAYRALSIEGYGSFNIYNNTAVHNQTPADLIRNVCRRGYRLGRRQFGITEIVLVVVHQRPPDEAMGDFSHYMSGPVPTGSSPSR